MRTGMGPYEIKALDLLEQLANGERRKVVTLEAAYTAAQTDTAIVTQGAGGRIAALQVQVTADEANTVGVGYRIGFGAANTPTTTGVVLTHPGLIPGSVHSCGDGSAVIGEGADGEDLRITSEVPTGGSIRVRVSYQVLPY